jgi:hypothetical protein
MNRIHSHLSEVDLIGKLADLKEEHYKNTLVLSAVIELLIEKDLISMEEIEAKAADLDLDLTIPEIDHPMS